MVSKKFDRLNIEISCSNSALGMEVEDIHCDVVGMANPSQRQSVPCLNLN